MRPLPQRGDFVRVRTRRWLVEDERSAGEGLTAFRLACVDDDAQGEAVDVLWDAELDGSVLKDEGWGSVARLGTDGPTVFSAYLRALRWNTATAADRDLFQAPFRAGIHQDAYQLLPLRKALRLPRVNLLIADDVGAGKTVEAGLVLREMLLRRRIDFVLVAAPAGMVRQWQDELEAKFGLSFTLIDREYLGILIYTATAGNQGTLGGLVEVTRRFVRILKSALERQRLCSGDPVCADHDPTTADEDRTLHGAACHGCLLVAETSCEARNLFLDRALIVDTVGHTGAGFF